MSSTTMSDEFAMFLKQNGVKHIRCAPYHPSSNGLAEWFLLSYRNTPHITTNEAPSTLLLGWKLRSLLDMLRPSVDKTVFDHQAPQKSDHDAGPRFRECLVGEQVLAYDPRNRTWKEGVVMERTGPTSYVVQTQGGEVLWKRHIDHIKPIAAGVIPSQATQHGKHIYLACTPR